MAIKRNSRAISSSSRKVCKNQRKLTSKILKEAIAQQREIKNEEKAQNFPSSVNFYGLEDVVDNDVDDDEVSDTQGQDDYKQEEEVKLLDAFFDKDRSIIKRSLADIIKNLKETNDVKESTSMSKNDATETNSMSKSEAFEYLQRVEKCMSEYTTGKFPKAVSFVYKSENWDSLLKLTHPENWSPHAMHKATKMFVSISNGNKAGHFLKLFLLPRVRDYLTKNKKLHPKLYESLISALFKPDGFYKGIIIPLCKSGTCKVIEAVIIGSVIHKFSIPQHFSSDALVNLSEMKFCGTTSYFMKVILEKKYALAYGAIDAVTTHFLRFHKETSLMPVPWHQTLLAFVQLYKHALREEDKERLRSLLNKQNHKLITPEIVRELEHSKHRGVKEDDLMRMSSLSASATNKPVKEDLFDMPQVPMEED